MSAKDVKQVAPSGGNAVIFALSEAHSFESAMRKRYENYYIIIDRDYYLEMSLSVFDVKPIKVRMLN